MKPDDTTFQKLKSPVRYLAQGYTATLFRLAGLENQLEKLAEMVAPDALYDIEVAFLKIRTKLEQKYRHEKARILKIPVEQVKIRQRVSKPWKGGPLR